MGRKIGSEEGWSRKREWPMIAWRQALARAPILAGTKESDCL